jgi:hypothetical protein
MDAIEDLSHEVKILASEMGRSLERLENIINEEKPKSLLNQFQIYHSDELNELFDAMGKAQGEMGKLISNETNPFYKAKYPTLDNVIDVYREPLAKNGLTFMQWSLSGGKMLNWLGHKSGQFISNVEELRIKDPSNPQAHGSSYSYLRRYSAMGVMGLGKASQDDDGNVASQAPNQGGSKGSGGSKPAKKGRTPKTPPKDDFSQQLADQGKVDFPPLPEDEKDLAKIATLAGGGIPEGKENFFNQAKAKMDEATALTHLQNIWNKHQKEWRENLGPGILIVQQYKEKKKEELVKIREEKDKQKKEETEGV